MASAPKDKSVFYVPIEKRICQIVQIVPDNVNQINWISHIVEPGDSLEASKKI